MTEVSGLRRFDSCADLIKDTIDPESAQNIPYIGLEHIVEAGLFLSGHGFANDVISAKSRFKKGDILFGKLRPYFRKVVIAPFDGVCSTDIWVVRAKPGIDQKYLFYWMASQEFVDDATRASEGTKMPRAKWEFVSRFEKEVPPLPTQHAIARILSSLDDKIELNRQMNETLEAMARAIFQSWFVDFDPVRAKAEGRQPSGMDAETASLFPNEFEKVDEWEVPRGWGVETLGNVAEMTTGRSYTSDELQKSTIALVTLKSFQRGGGYRQDGLKPFIGKYKPEQVIQPGELVISFTDVTQAAEVIGKPAIVSANPEFQTLVASLDVGIIRPKDERVSVPFLYLLLKNDDYQSFIYGYCSGTTVLHINKSGVPKYEFICPDPEIMKIFSKISKPIFDQIQINIQQSRTLAQIRDALLPKLMNGEISTTSEGGYENS